MKYRIKQTIQNKDGEQVSTYWPERKEWWNPIWWGPIGYGTIEGAKEQIDILIKADTEARIIATKIIEYP